MSKVKYNDLPYGPYKDILDLAIEKGKKITGENTDLHGTIIIGLAAILAEVIDGQTNI